ncbi:uncharacterized protein ARMOST_19457 [Armillaria ostoyae]|uniref:Uncharacterized protein n=1 Tax=Armillaria ostoyae TaxID=47428 RepID=A0A284S4N0_ARMOS|nr:uncharacterized protein ARMOST_19457 [Armillaria ostoyae]
MSWRFDSTIVVSRSHRLHPASTPIRPAVFFASCFMGHHLSRFMDISSVFFPAWQRVTYTTTCPPMRALLLHQTSSESHNANLQHRAVKVRDNCINDDADVPQ